MTEADIPSSRIPDIYTELGRLAGLVEAHSEQVAEQTRVLRALDCVKHRAALDELRQRILELEGKALPPASAPSRRPPSNGSIPVTARDLNKAVENTERTVVATIQSAIASEVTAALRAEREEERRRDEAARQLRAAAAAEVKVADDLALARQLSRWKAAVAGIVALVGAISGAGLCSISKRQTADTAALTQAVERLPPPVVVKVEAKTPIVKPTAPAKEE